ncbi:ribonuclease H-like protein, partial [Terfezia boudieri ATCC MYA-4762]
MQQAWIREREWEDVRSTAVEEDSNKKGRLYPREFREGEIEKESVVVIYCDGACRGNGTTEARASFGVFVSAQHPKNTAAFISEDLPQTNQVAELVAVFQALKEGVREVQERGVEHMVTASDSEYACYSLTRWIEEWKDRGYKGIKNARLFEQIDREIKEMERELGVRVQFWKISRESNGMADGLA